MWDNPELQRLKRAWLPECAQSKLIAQVGPVGLKTLRLIIGRTAALQHCAHTGANVQSLFLPRCAIYWGHARTLSESNRISCGRSLIRRVPY